ncbi:MAG: type IV pilin protein [Planctomycetota bacterium]
MKSHKGFTLLELMIVITLIAIITSIAIPNLLQSKITANESAVISTMRTVSATEEIYKTRFGSYGTFDALLEASLLDEVVAGGRKHGYTFSMITAAENDYACVATPDTIGSTGERGFRVDASGVIRFSPDGSQPTSSSPAVD